MSLALLPTTRTEDGQLLLDPLSFEQWWRSLPVEDYEAFIFYGGDEILLRFCCAFERLVSSDNRITPTRIVQAYAIATGMDPGNSEAVLRAGKAYEHPASRELLDRLSFREIRAAANNIARGYTHLLEGLLRDVQGSSLEERVSVADTIGKYMRIVKGEEQQLRHLRAKQAEKMREVIQSAAHQTEAPREAELPAFIKMLTRQFGKDKMKELLESA